MEHLGRVIPSQKGNDRLPTIHFQVRTVSSGEGDYRDYMTPTQTMHHLTRGNLQILPYKFAVFMLSSKMGNLWTSEPIQNKWPLLLTSCSGQWGASVKSPIFQHHWYNKSRGNNCNKCWIYGMFFCFKMFTPTCIYIYICLFTYSYKFLYVYKLM